MAGEVGNKRQWAGGNRRRHDRNKFRKTTNATQQRKDLGYGLSGILISCTPRHENHAYREAVMMLGKYCEDPPENKKTQKVDGKQSGDVDLNENEISENKNTESTGMDVSKALQAELSEIRDPAQKLFTRVDSGVNGIVFLRIHRPEVDIEKVVEEALKDARASGSPNSRHCIRIMPIHTTCYAKPEDAAKAAAEIVKKHFPPIVSDEKAVTYAISFRARLNTSAHREEFIPEIAKAIEECEPRYKVNLTTPDVTLIVEVLKTSCCIGTFRHFYQLAKMNLREAACPSKPKEESDKADKKSTTKSHSPTKTEEGKDTAKAEEGKDTAKAEEGKDTSEKEEGKDTAKAEEEKDTAKTEEGKDTSEKEEGKDTAKTEEEKDTAKTEEGKGTSEKEEGKDTAKTEEGKDTAKTEEGKDASEKEEGKDTARPEDVGQGIAPTKGITGTGGTSGKSSSDKPCEGG